MSVKKWIKDNSFGLFILLLCAIVILPPLYFSIEARKSIQEEIESMCYDYKVYNEHKDVCVKALGDDRFRSVIRNSTGVYAEVN